MNKKERVKAVLNFEIPDRVPIGDWYWDETINLWGLSDNVYRWDYFDHDHAKIVYDESFLLEKEVIEETDEFLIEINSYGVQEKHWKHHGGASLKSNYPVKTKKDWDYYRNFLKANVSRFNTTFEGKVIDERYQAIKNNELYTTLYFSGPFEMVRNIMDFEEIMVNMKLEPDFIYKMFNDCVDFAIGMIELLKDKNYEVDGVFIAEDLGYKNGPLFSPKLYKDVLYPAHKRLCQACIERGYPIIWHSDGNILSLIPLLIKAGITALQPLDVEAGLDVRKLKQKYGDQLVLMGNIDVNIMSLTKSDIEKEVKDKIMLAKKDGGYIYHSSHSIPPTVSLENYKYVLEVVKYYGSY